MQLFWSLRLWLALLGSFCHRLGPIWDPKWTPKVAQKWSKNRSTKIDPEKSLEKDPEITLKLVPKIY